MWGKVFDELFQDSDHRISAYFDRLEETQDDGELDEEELLDALISSGIKVSRRQAEVLLRTADKDGDGKIDKADWMYIASACGRGP
jgi:Ca2+-binding EF-hand superfamily protein